MAIIIQSLNEHKFNLHNFLFNKIPFFSSINNILPTLRAFQEEMIGPKKTRLIQWVGAFGVLPIFQSHKRWVIIVQQFDKTSYCWEGCGPACINYISAETPEGHRKEKKNRKNLRIMKQNRRSWQPYFRACTRFPSWDGRAAGGSRPRPPLTPNRSNYLVISAHCKAASLAFCERLRRMQPSGTESVMGGEKTKITNSAQRLLLAELSGRPIGQRTDRQSTAKRATLGRCDKETTTETVSNILPLHRCVLFPKTQSDCPRAKNDVIILHAL